MPVYGEFVNGNRSVTANFSNLVDTEVEDTMELHRTRKKSIRPASQGGFKDIFNTPKKAQQPQQQ